MDKSNLAILIPAYNESTTIKKVILGAIEFGDVIVVDDGSTDGTREIASSCGAIVLSNSINLGYDGALAFGAKYIADNHYSFFITMDADGQHPTAFIAKFIALFENGHCLVVGNRNKFQRIAEFVFAKAINTKTNIKDPLCGMKGYSADLLREKGSFDTYGSVGTELMFYALAAKVKVANVCIPVADRIDAPRFSTLFRANIRIFRALILGVTKY